MVTGQCAGDLGIELWMCDLRRLGRSKKKRHGRIRRQHRPDRRDHPIHRGVTPPVAALGGKASQLPGLAPTHEPGARDVPVGLTLAHARQDLSVLKHLESPSRKPGCESDVDVKPLTPRPLLRALRSSRQAKGAKHYMPPLSKD